MNILLVDDERSLIKPLSTMLKQNNYSVDLAYDGEEGLELILSGIYDLIILDVMMPKIDGFSLLKIIRDKKIDTPVLMLTAKSDVIDKIEGLNLGADDYITKPFDTNELLARIRALLRRKGNFLGNLLTFADFSLSRDTFELIKDGKKIALGKKEFQILEMLMLSKGKCVYKERIIEKIWGYDTDAEYNTVEVYLSFLRKKFTALNVKSEIRSIRGLGYMLVEKYD